MKEVGSNYEQLVATVEKNYFTTSRSKIYIALEDLDFIWDERDVYKVEALWKDGTSIWAIAEKMNRDPDEIAVLIMDLARKEKVSKGRGHVG